MFIRFRERGGSLGVGVVCGGRFLRYREELKRAFVTSYNIISALERPFVSTFVPFASPVSAKVVLRRFQAREAGRRALDGRCVLHIKQHELNLHTCSSFVLSVVATDEPDMATTKTRRVAPLTCPSAAKLNCNSRGYPRALRHTRSSRDRL